MNSNDESFIDEMVGAFSESLSVIIDHSAETI